jgi:uncharacterized repeat protein (TIGR03843 family)
MLSRDEKTLNALQKGILKLEGEFLWGSNYTFLAQVELNADRLLAVYKPTQGQRPLWDFPSESLARREVAAYLVSEALGWAFIPPTAYRQDGPMGPGSLQMFIEHDPDYHYFNFSPADRQRLRPVALFDHLVNNADRKGSHVIFGPDERMWLIDHGLCFHVDPKLRTVIWDFAGEVIPEDLCVDLSSLRQQLGQNSDLTQALGEYLSSGEVSALIRRADNLIAAGRYPEPDPRRRSHPWPPV